MRRRKPVQHLYWSQVKAEALEGAGWSNPEKNDCTVRAFAILCNATYEEALQLTQLHGRRKNKGLRTYEMIGQGNFKFNGYLFKEIPIPVRETGRRAGKKVWRTVGAFAKAHPRGRYLLRVKAHVLVLMDGVLVDYTAKPKRRLTWAFEIIKED